ncbi:hypothetical protein PHLGIDRAFT_465791 [Phlebiopsis gigantea 11061_1 CR5-6]|uniref:Uncharacterized protein n=1 Tax=Phlebiopsis gigantea (strain 11061_1 CR5-6) TaxID=745531 RepID=A0A0C3S9I0_PHLG1|nr:hypothetical protein PHLGIDRAFT_465791 [Phlebiopsis gigantea 11061_1 CR5-6]
MHPYNQEILYIPSSRYRDRSDHLIRISGSGLTLSCIANLTNLSTCTACPLGATTSPLAARITQGRLHFGSIVFPSRAFDTDTREQCCIRAPRRTRSSCCCLFSAFCVLSFQLIIRMFKPRSVRAACLLAMY